jgi:glycosidase
MTHPHPDPDAVAHVTSDFIFGTLATDELRLEAMRAHRRGLWHGDRIDPADPAPDDAVTLTVTVGSDLSATTLQCYLTTDGSDPDAASESIPFRKTDVDWDTLTWSYAETWRATIPPHPEGTLVRYRIAATTPDGATLWADADPDTGAPGSFAYSVDRFVIPAWLRDAVIYHVFVDRFAPDPGAGWREARDLNRFWGGTLRGLIDRLDHIADLGATAIWLSPVFPSPTHHGYDATDYGTIEPRLGTVDDLRALIDAAGARGIRILLDFVANHVSNEHPAFVRARQDAASCERSWFTFLPDGSYRSFFGVETMPQVAVDDDGAAAWLIDAARRWLELGVAGFRLDYANGPSRAFWSRFRRAMREIRSDAVLVGEIVESAGTMASYAGGLDGTLDFLLLQQLRAFLAFDVTGADAFGRFLERHLAWFGDRLALPSFLDNHDMNRFLWAVRGDTRRLKLAALLQFALPQPPIVYYGTEVGLSQWHDLEYPDGSRRMEESRTPMPWGEARGRDLLAWYRKVIAARRRVVTRAGAPVTALPATTGDLLLLACGDLVVALNRSEAAIDVPLAALGEVATVAVATDDAITIRDGAVHLPPMTGAWLTP